MLGIPRVRYGPLQRIAHYIGRYVPMPNFILLHYAYFCFTILIAALILWGSAVPFRSVSFTDSLFLAASAMTEAGLNTVNLSTLNTFQQAVLFTLIVLGSAIFVSASVVFVRLKAFEKEFAEHLSQQGREQQSERGIAGNAPSSHGGHRRQRPSQRMFEGEMITMDERAEQTDCANQFKTSGGIHYNDPSGIVERMNQDYGAKAAEKKYPEMAQELSRLTSRETTDQRARGRQPMIGQAAAPATHLASPPRRRHRASNDSISQSLGRRPLFTFSGVGAESNVGIYRPSMSSPRPTLNRTRPTPDDDDGKTPDLYALSSGTIARNSQFHGLTASERHTLGGYEYKAVLFLSFLVPIYFVAWQVLGAISLGTWVTYNRAQTTRDNGLNPFWVGAFNAISAFNNSGMSLLDANMVAFQDSIFMLLSMGLFILAGNTAYPIFIRLTVWTLWRVIPDSPRWRDARQTLKFLLDHPRRCYTNMFPARHTWWLALALLTLNGIDWAAFEILNIGNGKITILDPHIEVVDGLFQALAVRSGGFYVVPIPDIRISLQVLYVIMMYISVYPVVISMRNSNVYEERSLGIFAEQGVEDEDSDARHGRSVIDFLRRATGLATTPKPEDRAYFVKQQLRAQLAHDTWWIALAVFVIMIIEGSQFETNPAVFSVFNVIFEVVSAYGTVGISLGVPWASFSFCGSWHSLSKLVLVAVMIRGRHRGLPVAIDHAVQLPGVMLDEAEEEDGRARAERSERGGWEHAIV